MPEVLARLEQTKKVYRTGDTTITALDSTTLEIRSEELVLIEGPSGSGKTTLLSLIGCVIYPTEGQVFVRGTYTSALNDRQLSRLRLHNIGFVFQNFNLIAPFSALDNVAFPLRLMGMNGRAARREAMQQLEKFGLADRWESRPRQLSGGQKQRVAIARAMVSGPKILLCDEPTAALDHQAIKNIMSELKGLSQEGKAVVVVTHDPRLEEYADRIVRIVDGRIVNGKE
jgi:putative ABC transport system ATP-binding protein